MWYHLLGCVGLPRWHLCQSLCVSSVRAIYIVQHIMHNIGNIIKSSGETTVEGRAKFLFFLSVGSAIHHPMPGSFRMGSMMIVGRKAFTWNDDEMRGSRQMYWDGRYFDCNALWHDILLSRFINEARRNNIQKVKVASRVPFRSVKLSRAARYSRNLKGLVYK